MGKTSFSSRPFSATALFRKEFQQGDRIVRHDKIPREKTVRENHLFRRIELQLSRIRDFTSLVHGRSGRRAHLRPFGKCIGELFVNPAVSKTVFPPESRDLQSDRNGIRRFVEIILETGKQNPERPLFRDRRCDSAMLIFPLDPACRRLSFQFCRQTVRIVDGFCKSVYGEKCSESVEIPDAVLLPGETDHHLFHLEFRRSKNPLHQPDIKGRIIFGFPEDHSGITVDTDPSSACNAEFVQQKRRFGMSGFIGDGAYGFQSLKDIVRRSETPVGQIGIDALRVAMNPDEVQSGSDCSGNMVPSGCGMFQEFPDKAVASGAGGTADSDSPVNCGNSGFKKVIELQILRQLDAVKNGDITDEEMFFAKKSLNDIYRTINDSPFSIENWCFNRVISEKFYTPEEKADDIMKMDAGKVSEFARGIKLDTVFFLRGAGTSGLEEEKDEILPFPGPLKETSERLLPPLRQWRWHSFIALHHQQSNLFQIQIIIQS